MRHRDYGQAVPTDSSPRTARLFARRARLAFASLALFALVAAACGSNETSAEKATSGSDGGSTVQPGVDSTAVGFMVPVVYPKVRLGGSQRFLDRARRGTTYREA